jgi:type IV pilus assembly protein PilC
VDTTVKALTSIMEPLIIVVVIVVVGGIVGGIIIAMYLPMLQIFELIE